MEKDTFAEKVDKDQIQKDTQEDFSLHTQQKSFNKRCLRNFFLEQKKADDYERFFFPQKKKRDSNTFILLRREKIAKKEIWKQTCFFEKEKMFDQNY